MNLQNNDGDTAVMIALKKCNFNIANKLLDFKETNTNLQNNIGFTVLMITSDIKWSHHYVISSMVKNFKSIIDKLIEYKEINVNLQNNNGNTALMFASNEGNVWMVNKLFTN